MRNIPLLEKLQNLTTTEQSRILLEKIGNLFDSKSENNLPRWFEPST